MGVSLAQLVGQLNSVLADEAEHDEGPRAFVEDLGMIVCPHRRGVAIRGSPQVPERARRGRRQSEEGG